MDKKVLYLLERAASTLEEVVFMHIPSHSYNLSNLEVDRMARSELEKIHPETAPKKKGEIIRESEAKAELNLKSVLKRNKNTILNNINNTKKDVQNALDEKCEIIFTYNNKKMKLNNVNLASLFKLLLGM